MEVLLYKNTIDKFNIVSKVKNIASNPWILHKLMKF